jgi:succinate dehydrogenase / fumarate reductase membrane anchor subunit
MWGWLYMRFSGVLLVVLIFGHLLVNLFLGEGVKAIDFAFVAGKWADPFWIVYDTALLWLALIHGANGMRTIVNDYARGRLRVLLLGLLAAATIALLVLGTLVLTTFDPCPAGTPADLLPEFCSAR